MADVFTASLLQDVGEGLEVLLQEVRATDEPVTGREGFWLVCLCLFDFTMAGCAIALCLVGSFTASTPSPSPRTTHHVVATAPRDGGGHATRISTSTGSGAATQNARGGKRPRTASTTGTGTGSQDRPTSGTDGARGACHHRHSYVHPLQIADDFRDRWRTRWTHQQYFVRQIK